jgi:hypothetical protein
LAFLLLNACSEERGAGTAHQFRKMKGEKHSHSFAIVIQFQKANYDHEPGHLFL